MHCPRRQQQTLVLTLVSHYNKHQLCAHNRKKSNVDGKCIKQRINSKTTKQLLSTDHHTAVQHVLLLLLARTDT